MAEERRAWISLGSNIDPESNLPAAIAALGDVVRVVRVSSVWESAPVGDPDQPRFCNAAALVETSWLPDQLKPRLREIEDRLGRRRDPLNKNAARTIDLDLSLFDDWTVTTSDCRIPDPDLLTRPFVAVPLAEISPDYIHPVEGCTLRQIADRWLGDSELTSRPDILLAPAPS